MCEDFLDISSFIAIVKCERKLKRMRGESTKGHTVMHCFNALEMIVPEHRDRHYLPFLKFEELKLRGWTIKRMFKCSSYIGVSFSKYIEALL